MQSDDGPDDSTVRGPADQRCNARYLRASPANPAIAAAVSRLQHRPGINNVTGGVGDSGDCGRFRKTAEDDARRRKPLESQGTRETPELRQLRQRLGVHPGRGTGHFRNSRYRFDNDGPPPPIRPRALLRVRRTIPAIPATGSRKTHLVPGFVSGDAPASSKGWHVATLRKRIRAIPMNRARSLATHADRVRAFPASRDCRQVRLAAGHHARQRAGMASPLQTSVPDIRGGSA